MANTLLKHKAQRDPLFGMKLSLTCKSTQSLLSAEGKGISSDKGTSVKQMQVS